MKHKKSVIKPLLVSCECSDGTSAGIAPNGKTLGAVADLETETVPLAPNSNRNENLILTEKTAIEPNVC